MSPIDVDELLQKMQSIAETVNLFKSEAVQQQAFNLLMRVAGMEDNSVRQVSNDTDKPAANVPNARQTTKSVPAKSTKSHANKPTFVKDLNLRPQGKEALKEFVAKKSPKTNEERFSVIVYYLQKELGVNDINPSHIYTAFKDLGVKVPLDISDALYKCANRKGWIDTSNISAVTLTIPGENFVEHDLPKQEPKK